MSDRSNEDLNKPSVAQCTARNVRRKVQKGTQKMLKHAAAQLQLYHSRISSSAAVKNTATNNITVGSLVTTRNSNATSTAIVPIQDNSCLHNTTNVVEDLRNLESSGNLPENFVEPMATVNHSNMFRDDYYYECCDAENDDVQEDLPEEKMNPVGNFIKQYKNEKYDYEVDESQLLLNAVSYKLQQVIGELAVRPGTMQAAATEFLHSIRLNIPVLSLPLDVRTIIKTPRVTSKLHEIAGGEYCHFGLGKCIENIVDQRSKLNLDSTTINLTINIDGAPVDKSSGRSIWPILCSEKDINDVYIIGVYCGKSKPTNADEYLNLFVQEAIDFVNNGFKRDDIEYTISIYALIFDAPAKAFLLNIKGHTGYDSCTKCMIEGAYGSRNMCFPGKPGKLRTDEEFRQLQYKEDVGRPGYQKGETLLTKIPGLGLVTQVPLDPLHLAYLGINRKLLFIWLFAPFTCKLDIRAQNAISEQLVQYQQYIPYEFARRPRPLSYVKLFKGTEHRQFALYTGPLALKDNIDMDCYENFIDFHVVLTILSSPYQRKKTGFVDYAENLSGEFVEEFERLYGDEYVTHNVHNFYHLAEDSRRYGEIENFSAFKFESFLGRIKSMLRKGNQTLQQLQRRLEEIENVNVFSSKVKNNSVEVSDPHYGFIDIDGLNVKSQHSIVKFPSFKINCNDDKNNCVLIDDNLVVEVSNIVKDENDTVYIIGKRLEKIGDLYTSPIRSSALGIHKVRRTTCSLEKWTINRISAKLFKLPYESDFVTFPILHTYK